ncbi:MAG: GYF domain-containing protein [Desulfurivibrionaceae bacterium]
MIAKCPKCNSVGKLADQLAGNQVRCPKCGFSFVAETIRKGNWYYAEGDRKKGPIKQQEFERLLAAGDIVPETLVWRKGMNDWQPLAEVRLSAARTWYYAEGNSKAGPVSQDQFNRLVAGRTISADTLVWSKGMTGWQPLSEINMSSDSLTGREKCGECGNDYMPTPLTGDAEEKVCENCKFEGSRQALSRTRLKYGSLPNRFVAKIIDLLFMLAMAGMIEGLSRKLFPDSYAANAITPVFMATLTLNMLLGVFYVTWFVGKFGATPGKMVLKLKISNPPGNKIGYLHAFGRYCGEYIAGLGIMGFLIVAAFWILGIMLPANPWTNSIAIAVLVTLGLVYAPAIFDSKRRTLYDRLCNTRVLTA